MKGVLKMERLKNFFCAVGIVGIFILSGLLNNYSMGGYVESVENGVVIFVDETGDAWEYESNEFEVGERVKITFCDFETISRTDDAIVGVKKVR